MACSPGWRQALHHHLWSALQGQRGRVEPSAPCTGYVKGPKRGKNSVKTPTYHTQALTVWPQHSGSWLLARSLHINWSTLRRKGSSGNRKCSKLNFSLCQVPLGSRNLFTERTWQNAIKHFGDVWPGQDTTALDSFPIDYIERTILIYEYIKY